jgi:hypothetical protein
MKSGISALRNKSKLAIAGYIKLPDPPIPGTEDEQLARLRACVSVVAEFFVFVSHVFPDDEQAIQAEAEAMIRPFNHGKTRQDLVRFDIARSIVETACRRAWL